MSTTAPSDGALETRGIEPVPHSERRAKTEYGPGWVATITVSFLLYVVPPRPTVAAPAVESAKEPAAIAV